MPVAAIIIRIQEVPGTPLRSPVVLQRLVRGIYRIALCLTSSASQSPPDITTALPTALPWNIYDTGAHDALPYELA